MKLDIINKLIHLILSFSLLGSVLAKVKKAKSSGLNQEDIFNRITAYPTDNGVLNLSEKDFKDFIKTPRNFSLAVALTALGAEFGCTQCVEFDENLKLVASSWQRNPNKNKLFIGVLDFENAQSVFIKYKLRGAPNLFYFPASEATSKDPKHEEYELSTKGFEPEPLVKFLEEKTGEKIKIVRPINWKLYGGIAGVVTLLGLAGYFILPKLKNIFVETNIWAALSLVFILMMVSGHMFNQIRHPSFMAQEKSGKVKVWHQGFQDQYGVESQIIALVYGVSSFIIVTLVSKVTPIKNEYLKFALVAILCLGLSGTLIYLSSVFYTKFPMYPFTLLK